MSPRNHGGRCTRQSRRILSRPHVCRNATIAGLFLGPAAGRLRKEGGSAKPGPPEVNVVEPLQQDVPVYVEWVAQLNGPVNAEITPKVQGYLLRQDYQNGYFVRKGQLLFELDPRQYQAALDQSKADVAAAQANLDRVQADVLRDTPLAAQSAIPQKQLDNDVANQASWEAQVKAKKAALDNAELNLAWTKVYSPIDGIAGVSSAQVGDLVGTATKMATVSQVNPIWAYFNISESSFFDIAPKITEVISGKVPIEKLACRPWNTSRPTTSPTRRRDGSSMSIARSAPRPEPFSWPASFPNQGACCGPADSDGCGLRPA